MLNCADHSTRAVDPYGEGRRQGGVSDMGRAGLELLMRAQIRAHKGNPMVLRSRENIESKASTGVKPDAFTGDPLTNCTLPVAFLSPKCLFPLASPLEIRFTRRGFQASCHLPVIRIL